MSTDKTNIPGRRIAQLARTKETLFHTKELAVIWGISDTNNLYTTLKRYVKNKILFRVYKGLYSLLPLEQVDRTLLGLKALHQYAYLSTETVLFNEGVIFQPPSYITLISKISRQFTIGKTNYKCRQMEEKSLYQNDGIMIKGRIRIAGIERAIADLLYFNPRAHVDNKKVNWEKVKELQRKLGYI